MIKYIYSTLIFTCLFLSALSNTDGDKNKINSISKDNKKSLESICNAILKQNDSVNIWWRDKTKASDSILNIKIPRYPEYIYDKRISYLNELGPIKLEYNEFVLKYIKAYGESNRDKLSLIMDKSAYYFPIIEMYLDRYKLPLELKYLAAVESALDPNAISKSGAVGLWQFMKNTSDLFDLKVSSYVDERRDVFLATDAACRYLKYLYETFGDWQLALVAYNGGPGTVKKAIARSGGKTNYWELRPYFTDQMQNYVPAFIAMNYLMNYHIEHNIYPNNNFIEAYKTDTLIVRGPLYLKTVAEITNNSLDYIKQLNPCFVYAFIPNDGKDYSLVLPVGSLHVFLENINSVSQLQDSIVNQGNSVDDIPFLKRPERKETVYYVVCKGDNLFRLSAKYNCSIPEIYEWNNLPDNYMLKVGDRLKFMQE